MVDFTVSGRVLDAEGNPPPTSPVLIVRAFDHTGVHSLTNVGLPITLPPDGTYEISWSQSTATAVNLVVKVLQSTTEVGRSRIIFGARAKETVDVILDDFIDTPVTYLGRTEYDRVSSAVEAAIPGVSATDVVVRDLEWICGKAGIYPPYVALYVQARKLNEEHDAVPTKAFYGLGRRGMSLHLPLLLAQGTVSWRRTLEEAYDRRLIPVPTSGTVDDEIDDIVDALQTLMIEGALTIPAEGRSMKAILNTAITAGLPEVKQPTFLEQWAARTGTVAQFWTDLLAHPDFDSDDVDLLQFTLMSATLTQQYVPALVGLQTKRTADDIETFEDLTAWSVDDWVDFLEDPGLGPINAPDYMAGETTGEKVQSYAKALERTIAIAHPTRVLARRIEAAGSVPSTSGVVAFLDANPDFEVTGTILAKYLDENPLADPGEAIRNNILAVQRVHHISPKHAKYQAAITLLENGYTSAHAIAMKGKADFVAELGTALDGTLDGVAGVDVAKVVYETASLKSAATLMLMTMFASAFKGVGTTAVLSLVPNFGEEPPPGLPTLSSLFGTLDYCECPHCRSVYSPAAYLVDLLHFLRGSAAEGAFSTALAVLLDRRPDLATLELSCDNTNIVLPYIDLVNEVLENAIAPPVTSYQTTWSPEDLAITPEHEKAAAYTPVAAAVHPWILPFQRWDDEVRIYLQHLGVPRQELMSVLEASGTPSTTFLRDMRAEALGLTTKLRNIISGDAISPSVTDAEFWGLVDGAGWHTPLEHADEMMVRAGLSYAELEELLHMRFIDPNEGTPSTELAISFDPAGCDLANAWVRVNNGVGSLTTAAVGRIHRFARFWRHLPLRPRELDAAIRDLGAGSLTQDCVRFISAMETVRARFGLTPFEALSWWAPLDTRTYAWDGEICFYERLFQNRVITFPLDADFALLTDRSDLVGTPDDLTVENIPTVLAALRIKQADYDALVASAYCTVARSLANLSALQRHAALARALGVTVPQLVTLRKLSGQNPFTNPETTIAFVEMVDAVLASGFSLEELDYLCRHVVDPFGKLAVADDDIATALTALVAGLQAIPAPGATPEDPFGAVVRSQLEIVISLPADVQTTMEILDKDPPTSMDEGDQSDFVTATFAAFLTPDEVTTAIAQLVTGGGAITTSQARFEYVLKAILGYLDRLRHEDFLDQTVAAAMKISRDSAHRLVFDLLENPADAGEHVRDVLLAPAFVATDLDADPLTRAANPNEFAAWERVAKAALLVRGFALPSDQLPWFFTASPPPEWLDLNALPLAFADDGSPVFSPWNTIRREMDLRSSFRSDTNVHQAIVDAGAGGMAVLAEATGWAQADLEFLASDEAFDLDLVLGADVQDEVNLLRLREAMLRIQRLGVSAEQAWSWVNSTPTQNQAHAVRRAAKSKYGQERWPDIARPLQNRLREQRRDVLLTYLIATEADFDDADDVYAHYLIDTEMSACMMTSRLKQAISSVQMFVQRILLNMEADATMLPTKAEQWKWMKSYRVWEANRKVFLYPENWVEPELRDDKTPFFTELERELRSSELDDVSVENAYKAYLLKLHGVADLEVMGCHHQRPEVGQPQDIFHVIARTRGGPHKYFYRRRIDDAFWTPWEEVPLEIEGDNVCPVMHNRRLFLFWATFVDGTDSAESQDPPPPKKFLQPIVMWSEFWNGEWTRQRSTRLHKRAKTSSFDGEVPREALLMKALVGGFDGQDTALWIELSQVNDSLLPDEIGGDRAFPANGACTHVFARYRYNDCTDRLIFDRGDVQDHWAYTAQRLGAPAGCDLAAQQFDSTQDVDDQFMPVVQDTGKVTTHYEQVFVQTPTDFRVLLPQDHTYPQPERTRRPRFFFYDEHHSFYVVQRLASLPVYTAVGAQVDAPDSSVPTDDMPPPEPVLPSTPNFLAQTLDLVKTPGLWGDAVPGIGSFVVSKGIDPNDVAPAPTLALKALSAANQTMGGGLSPTDGLAAYGAGNLGNEFVFSTFYHPYTCLFLRELNRHGIDGLLAPDPETDLKRQLNSGIYFADTYVPTDHVAEEYPIDDIDFSYGGAYSTYNWELFFHAPILIAKRLTADQRFEEAMRWYHYVFNPMDTSEAAAPKRFWNMKELYNEASGFATNELLVLLGYEGTAAQQAKAKKAFYDQVNEWRQNPFLPHRIARMRPEAYAKSVVMGYLDNLISWGDNLFRRDTIETINEATQLYVLAAQILGPRPVKLPEQVVEVRTWDDVRDSLDAFSNAKVALENFPYAKDFGLGPGDFGAWVGNDDAPKQEPPVLGWYFCYPPNDRLFAYWDTVADRLFKIRHCMNIEGVVRQLPLFEPPIDPGLLVKAVAAGVDISSAIQDAMAPPPLYRYSVMSQRAMDLCGEVRTLGGAFLSAMEKRDGERLALLRSTHEVSLLSAIEDVRKQQIAEAKANVDALLFSRATIALRLAYYQRLVQEGLSDLEKAQLVTFGVGAGLQAAGGVVSLVGSFMHYIPDFSAGGLVPVFHTYYGGSNVGEALQGAGQGLTLAGTVLKDVSSILGTQAGWKRREQEWKFSVDTATSEMLALDKQIAAAQLRIALAELELRNHRRQMENAREVDDFMRSKFTNDELYDWMIGQVSELHFRAYQLAFDMAKRAERAYRFELDRSGSSFVTFGYWDSLKKGLMAGERLQFDLRRMDASYLEENRREYELTKNIPLSQLDAVALVKLRETGSCFIDLPEALFDLDHPGHYLRRIRSVSVTIPAVTGPYVTVAAKLTLLKDTIRAQATPTSPYARSGDDFPRFRDRFGGTAAIATSTGQNDHGMFELSFRDERYLPFEGAGAISSWQLELTDQFRQFDYRTIGDVILQLSYTAREGGTTLRTAATGATGLRSQLNAIVSPNYALGPNGLSRLFSCQEEFPVEWNKFLFPADDADTLQLALPMSRARFPFAFRSERLHVTHVELVLVLREGLTYDPPGGSSVDLPLPLTLSTESQTITIVTGARYGNSPFGEHAFDVSYDPDDVEPWEWSVDIDATATGELNNVHATVAQAVGSLRRLVPENIRDLLLIVHYDVEAVP